jgi:8-amino-7-oxononanoate synthase
MIKMPLKLEKRLQKRKEDDSFRKLLPFPAGVDFFSNDYLGLARSEEIAERALKILATTNLQNGSSGSRLLSGNHILFSQLENQLSVFHNSQAALVFNSGYDANIGFFSSVPQKNDIILYDEFSHASIRDGLKMSLAKHYKFRHNDLEDLEEKLKRYITEQDGIDLYVVTESVFSMDGDSPDLRRLVEVTERYKAFLIIDEAHATGVSGENGAGLVQDLKLESKVFARIHTFGKAVGCHGAVILGNRSLKDYLVNFSRSFIYTTALSPHSVATISACYRYLEMDRKPLEDLKENIEHFRSEIKVNGLQNNFIESTSAIQSCVIPGNKKVKAISQLLAEKGFLVKPILSPTVPAGSERLRFCIHTYNSRAEISEVLKVLGNFALNTN